MKAQTHYDVLGVAKDVLPEVIDAAYKALAKKFHPDRSKDPNAAEVMRRINEAHSVLADPKRRRVYDRTLEQVHGRSQNGTEGFPNVNDFMRGAANAYPNAYPFTDETIQQEIQAAGIRIAQRMMDRLVDQMPAELAILLKNAILRGGGR